MKKLCRYFFLEHQFSVADVGFFTIMGMMTFHPWVLSIVPVAVWGFWYGYRSEA